MTSRNIDFDRQLALTANNPSVNSFANAHAEQRLILRPPFQRNLVWNDEQRSYLIDSILRNLPVPELYLQTDADESGNETMTVVDGQQRLSACLAFLADNLRLVGEDLDPRWRGRIYSELPRDLKLRFRNYRLLVRDLPSLDDSILREVFRRLNRVVEPLMPQELRHAAYTGPYIELIEAAASQPIMQQLGVFSARDFRRRGNDELVAEITYAVISGAFPNKKEGLEESFLTYERHGFPVSLKEDTERRFGRLFAQLEKIASGVRRSRFRNKSDFYSLAYLLLRRAEQLPLPEEANAALVQQLNALTTAVADLRAAEAEEPQYEPANDHERLVVKYTRAVERAASDRLNRVRRHEVLAEWLGSAIAQGTPRDLAPEDADWLTRPDDVEEPEDEAVDDEREHFQQVLLTSNDFSPE